MRFRLIFFFLFPFHLSAQELLVNGTFEDINICTEYRIECAPEAWISSTNGFANYFKEAKRAHSGVNCMAVEAGNFKYPYQRTFLRSRLLCGLRKGSVYAIEFYIKSFHFVLDSIGIRFTAGDPFFDKTPLHRITPSLYIDSVVRPMDISDSLWHKVSVRYTATGEERFISFGYFARRDYVGERSHPLENKYFVYLDDIYMNPVDPNEKLCEGWEEIRDQIYSENERHSLLQKKISYYQKNPPPPPTITRTVYTSIDTLVLPDILFATGKADLQPESHALLDSFCRHIMSKQVDSIVVEGHTDSAGTYQLNERLSLSRANAVMNYIHSKTNIPGIITRGWAFLKPAATNSTPEGRKKNRRVEVFLYVRE
jgi:outer membrane protein OmpA-like peptidoglycan-associated protein